MVARVMMEQVLIHARVQLAILAQRAEQASICKRCKTVTMANIFHDLNSI